MRSFITTTILLLTCSASAAVFDHPPTDTELVDRSDLVVVGTVRHAGSRAQNAWLVTDYELAVEETLKGSAAPIITITEAGGTANGRILFIADSATYAVGERVLAFLHRAPDGTYYTAFMKLGKFEFARNTHGVSVLVRDMEDFA